MLRNNHIFSVLQPDLLNIRRYRYQQVGQHAPKSIGAQQLAAGRQQKDNANNP
jgi:hypothetical protein